MTRTHLFGGALFFAGLTTGGANASPDSARRGCGRLAAALVATSSLVTAPAFADILNVPGDFPTIQGAIDAAVDGDDVVVAPGEYVESIDFLGKTIILRSVHGAEVTTIDGNAAGTVVSCESGEGPGAALQGFTVANGDNWPDEGGGMRIGAASTLTVSDCTFTNNYAHDGGGMFNAGNVTLTSCTFVTNEANDSFFTCAHGGGLHNPGYATIIDCNFQGNSALIDPYNYTFSLGGGMFNGGTALILSSSFDDNYATDGGGAYSWGNLTLIDCTFTDNSTHFGGYGGGVRTSGDTTIINGAFIGNVAGDGGGGVADRLGGDATIINCAFIDNFSGSNGRGGGVRGDATIVNSLFIANLASLFGGAVYGDGDIVNSTFIGNETSLNSGGGVSGDGEIRNSILWGNMPDQIDGDADVSYSNVQGGWPGQGNIDADPLLVDPENGDYRLSPGSPCIDAGVNAALPSDEFDLDEDGDTDEALPFDLDGNPRLVDDPATKDTGNGDAPIVDMGAYEFQVVASCTWDLDGDEIIGTGDLIVLLGSWGDPYGTADLIDLLGNWGPCPK